MISESHLGCLEITDTYKSDLVTEFSDLSCAIMSIEMK